MPVTRRVLQVVAGLALAAGAAACGGASEARPSISAAEADAEYVAEQPALRLAPGWQWPADVHFAATGLGGGPIVYQPGFGTTMADSYWYCSWQSRYLTPGLSDAASREAEAMLRTVRDTHLYQADILPGDRPAFDKVLDDALAGRKGLMARNVRLNCEKGANPLAPTMVP